MPGLQADALVVHLFVAADGVDPVGDEAFVREVWQRCRARFEMSEQLVPDVPLAPTGSTLAGQRPQAQLLAACARPGPAASPHIEEAVLRRVHDTFCLSVIREPVGASWTGLNDDWEEALAGLRPSRGVIGLARVFQARLTGPGPLAGDAALTAAVRARRPPGAPRGYATGVVVPAGFAVWEDMPPADGARDRRVLVVAGEDKDCELSAWTWAGVQLTLPRFARYLMHAAKVRYQWRVWHEAQGYRGSRRTADATVDRLLQTMAGRTEARELSQAELLEAAREMVGLQAGELGLVRTISQLREMRRTVDIAKDNLVTLSEDVQLGGLFAYDRELATWLGQQLEDDLTYLDAARECANQVGTLVDQLVQRGQQRRQERINLGLTGIIGAILMSLAAIQSLAYQVPLDESIKPSVVATLGALALLASLVVLRFAVPERSWPVGLVWFGVGSTAAAAAWVAVSAILFLYGPLAQTWEWTVAAFVAGFAGAALGTLVRRRR